MWIWPTFSSPRVGGRRRFARDLQEKLESVPRSEDSGALPGASIMEQTEEFRISTGLEDTHWWYLGIYNLIQELLGTPGADADLLILDAGCGSGGLLRALRSYPGTIGMDVAQEALVAARRSGADAVARGSVECLPLPDSCVDVVISIDLLSHHLCDERAALREIRRVLKPGGVLLLNLPAYEWLKGPHDRAGWNRRRYRSREVLELLLAAGFCVERMTYRNTFLFPIAGARRLAQKVLGGTRSRSDVTPLPAWLNNLLFSVLVLETRFLRRFDLPFGLSLFAVARKPTQHG